MVTYHILVTSIPEIKKANYRSGNWLFSGAMGQLLPILKGDTDFTDEHR